MSFCPRCASPRDHRDGPYFVCADCHWCWTVSITGTIYVQSDWPLPPRGEQTRDQAADAHTRRLLRSVDGLADRLSGPWPAPSLTTPFTTREMQRLQQAREATAADYFNEGLPLEQLKAEGVWLDTPPDA